MMADEMSPRRLERIGVDHDILERAKALENIIHSSEGYETVEVILGELISEVERLRSENLDYSCIARDLDFDITKKARLIDAQHDGILRLRKRLAAKDARIKELEEANRNIDKRRDEMAAFIERLEAAFLEATKEIVYATHEGRDAPEGEDVYAEKVAREALEQLQAEGKVGGGKTEYGGQHHCGTQISHTGGGEWHCPKCNPLLTAEQREEEGKRDA